LKLLSRHGEEELFPCLAERAEGVRQRTDLDVRAKRKILAVK